MVSYCCVKGCSNNSNQKKKDPNALVSFHAFPCNQELKTKWLRAIGRPNWAPPSHARICSIHFNNDQINFEGCRIRIKDDSVPVNSLPVNSNFEASDVEACRICLATDVRLYNLQDSQLSSCMASVAGLNENYNIEGLPQYVCYQCTAYLMRCYKLVEKSMTAQATLLDIFAKHGQITKSLIKQQNRSQLNLNASLTCCPTKNYDYYTYDEDSNISYKSTLDSTDIYFKNENDDKNVELDIKMDCNIDKNVLFEEMELAENKLNEEMSIYNDVHLEDAYGDGSVGDNISDKDVKDIEENIEINRTKTKRLNNKERSVRKKSTRNKASNLTPYETDMQKYFDIVPLSLQEQIEEWKRTAVRRALTSETIYECEVCSKVFAHVNTYKVHIASHDASRGKAECPVCKLRFKSATLAKSHANRAHGKKFYCKTCPKVFNNVGVAKKHHRWHFGYTYSCASCAFRSAHESALGAHVRRAHAHAHACAACGRACVSERGLATHTATAHRGDKDIDISKEYRCEECNVDFASEGARRVHLLTSSQHRKKNDLCISTSQSAELRNSCRRCGVQCASFAELVSHARSQHPRNNKRQWRTQDVYPTDCKLCGETLSCRRTHWQHVRRQHPKETDTYRPVVTAVCDTCGKGFQNSTKLHLHQLRHGAPTVRCEACPRLFYDKYALARHATTHRTNKPYQCRTCGRAFKLRSNLERHSRVHTDVAPYNCTMCGKKFKYSSSVNLHIRTVHYKLPHPPRKKRSKSNKDGSIDM